MAGSLNFFSFFSLYRVSMDVIFIHFSISFIVRFLSVCCAPSTQAPLVGYGERVALLLLLSCTKQEKWKTWRKRQRHIYRNAWGNLKSHTQLRKFLLSLLFFFFFFCVWSYTHIPKTHIYGSIYISIEKYFSYASQAQWNNVGIILKLNKKKNKIFQWKFSSIKVI